VLLAVVAGGDAGFASTVLTEFRLPRLAVAALAGAALALAGALVQSVVRNPLAEPSLIGISGGAGVGALGVLLLVPAAGTGAVALGAFAGALVAFAAVYVLAWKGGMAPLRLVLVGVGVAAFTASVINLLVLTAQLQLAQSLTWLSGSTYARGWAQAQVVAVALLVVVPPAVLALGDEAPRSLGLRLQRTRAVVLTGAALLAGTAVAAVGTVAFLGLLAPHAARLLVGAAHRRALPVAAALGAATLVLADTVRRTVIAPAEIPSGLLAAVVGTPYLALLLRRTARPA
jgi:iron complex transport system permease protein